MINKGDLMLETFFLGPFALKKAYKLTKGLINAGYIVYGLSPFFAYWFLQHAFGNFLLDLIITFKPSIWLLTTLAIIFLYNILAVIKISSLDQDLLTNYDSLPERTQPIKLYYKFVAIVGVALLSWLAIFLLGKRKLTIALIDTVFVLALIIYYNTVYGVFPIIYFVGFVVIGCVNAVIEALECADQDYIQYIRSTSTT